MNVAGIPVDERTAKQLHVYAILLVVAGVQSVRFPAFADGLKHIFVYEGILL